MKISSLINTLSTFCCLSASALLAQTENCRTILAKNGVELAYPRLSADNTRILYQTNQTGKWQIRIYNLKTKTDQTITTDTLVNCNFPDWSPDNSLLAYTCDQNGDEEIMLYNLETKVEKNVSQNPGRDIHPYFSPDGKYILFNSTRGNGSLDIYRYEIETGKTLRLTDTPDDETCARYSNDMSMIVYLRNGINGDDVFVLHTTNFLSENITRTPAEMDGWPMFSSDDRWIYFSSFLNGNYSIYRIKPDGSDRYQITFAAKGEEHARFFISRDLSFFIYNKRTEYGISIEACDLIKN